MEQQVFEGQLSEITTLTRLIQGNPRVRLIILPSEKHVPLRAGIFKKELEGLTDEDFKLAEWHGPKDEEFE